MTRLQLLMLSFCVLGTSFARAQDKTVGHMISDLTNKVTIVAEANAVRELGQTGLTACSVGGRSARCSIRDDIVYSSIFAAAFQAQCCENELEIDSSLWRKSKEYTIVQVHTSQTSWLPTPRVADGEATAAKIRKLAASGETFGCWENHCQIVLSAQVGGATTFAVCGIVSIEGVRGAPKHCAPFLFEDSQGAWIKAVTAYTFHGINPHAPLSETVALRTARELGITDSELIAAADKALTKEPFVFEKRSIRGGYNSLLAVANPRPSKVLPGGWYEWPTVAINPNRLTLYIDCDLLVNKYNTSQSTDWHQPTPSQQATYCNALFATIQDAVGAVCERYGKVRKEGSNRLSCEPK